MLTIVKRQLYKPSFLVPLALLCVLATLSGLAELQRLPYMTIALTLLDSVYYEVEVNNFYNLNMLISTVASSSYVFYLLLPLLLTLPMGSFLGRDLKSGHYE